MPRIEHVLSAACNAVFSGLSDKPKISQIDQDLHEISLEYCKELIRVYLIQIISDLVDLRLV